LGAEDHQEVVADVPESEHMEIQAIDDSGNIQRSKITPDKIERAKITPNKVSFLNLVFFNYFLFVVSNFKKFPNYKY
jgi:hypothetical protein